MKQYPVYMFCSWHCLVLYTQVRDTELQDAPVKTPGTLILCEGTVRYTQAKEKVWRRVLHSPLGRKPEESL